MDDMASVGLQVDSRGVREASGDLDRFARSGDRAGGSAGRATAAIGGMSAKMVVAAAAAAALTAAVAAGKFLNNFVDATVEAEKAQAQLGATITSTGGAAGKSVADLNAHAASLQRITNFGDDTINAMQGVLLTFTQIKGDQFDAATVAILDMSQALGKNLQESALQVGKALNDPVKGIAALAESGIQFTDAQKETVKEMVEANNTIGAQTIILAELEKQFGGSAEAARDTLGGALDSLRNAFGDLFELSGPGSENLRVSIERLTKAVADPAFFAAVQSIGTALFRAAEIGVEALTALSGAFTFVSENIDTLAVAIIGLVSTAIPGAITGLVAMTGGMSAAGIATGIFTGAVSAARLALIALGGPLGIVFGLLGAAAGAFFLFRDNAGEMETASYDAESGALALAEALDKVTAAEPESSAAAIALANNNVKLADSAYEAAKAEVAKMRAIADAGNALLDQNPLTAGGNSGYADAMADNLSSAQKAAIAAEKALATAIRDRKLASEEIVMTMPVVAARTNDANDAASGLADEMGRAANSAIDFVANLGRGAGLAGLRAEVSALASGMGPADVAAASLEAKIRSSAEFKAAMSGPSGFRAAALKGLQSELTLERERVALTEKRSALLTAPNKTGGGSGGGAAGKIDQEREAIDGVVDSLKDQIAAIGETSTARKTAQALRQAGVSLYSKEGQQIADLVEQYAEMQEAQRKSEEISRSLKDSILDFALEGTDALDGMTKAFQRMALEAALFGEGMMGNGGGGLLGGLVDSAAGALSGLLGGSASAGPLAGQPLFDIASSFDGGGYTGSGARTGGLDGRGGFMAMMHPRERVYDETRCQGRNQGGDVNNIKVIAPEGSKVDESRQQNSTGGEDLTILIDRTVSGLARDPGSAISRTLNTGFGVNRSTRSR